MAIRKLQKKIWKHIETPSCLDGVGGPGHPLVEVGGPGHPLVGMGGPGHPLVGMGGLVIHCTRLCTQSNFKIKTSVKTWLWQNVLNFSKEHN